MSVALLLRHSLQLESEAALLEKAVAQAIGEGACTPDIALPGARRSARAKWAIGWLRSSRPERTRQARREVITQIVERFNSH